MSRRHRKPTHLLIQALLALLLANLGFAATFAIWAILTGRFDEQLARTIVTALFGSTLAGLLLAHAHALRRRRLPVLMWAGIVAGLGAYAMGLLYLWELLPLNARFRWIAYLTATLAVIAVMSAYAGPIVVLETRSSILGVLRAILLRGIGLWNAAIITLIWFGSSLEALNRTLFGLLLPVISYSGLLLLLAGLLLAAAIRSDEKRRRRQRDALPARIRLTMTCPRCAAKQEFPIGAAKCAQCGFRMMIEIEEPRCECGYSLYQLRSDVCPECGRRVPAQQRWSRAPAPHH